jgi:hypothetical protein
MTAADVATVAAWVTLCTSGPGALIVFGRWIERRSHVESVAAQTYPSASDVAAQESAIAQDVWVAQVGEIQADVEAALAGLRGTA